MCMKTRQCVFQHSWRFKLKYKCGSAGCTILLATLVGVLAPACVPACMWEGMGDAPRPMSTQEPPQAFIGYYPVVLGDDCCPPAALVIF